MYHIVLAFLLFTYFQVHLTGRFSELFSHNLMNYKISSINHFMIRLWTSVFLFKNYFVESFRFLIDGITVIGDISTFISAFLVLVLIYIRIKKASGHVFLNFKYFFLDTQYPSIKLVTLTNEL